MSDPAYPCPLCGDVHDEARRICPVSGKRIPEPAGGALDPSELALLESIVGGRYLVKGVLGQGGMASVFEAVDQESGRVVALKVLRQKHARNHVSVKRLLREAKLAAALGHPNIAQVLDLNTLPDGTPYLAMERMYGETLAQRLTRDKFLPFDELVPIIAQVLDALATAHARAIVHRDITPGNVFILEALGPRGEGAADVRANGPYIKILDFGFSKLLIPSNDGGTETGLTGEGIVVGTPHYMSPEQIRGDKQLDGRVDLFAVGAVMYRAATGERPFSGPTMSAVLHAILTKTPPPPSQVRPGLPAGLDLVLATALARDKNKRFSTAAEFRRALSAFGPTRTRIDELASRQAQVTPRASSAAFDVFDAQEESGEHGVQPDSVEIEFETSAPAPATLQSTTRAPSNRPASGPAAPSTLPTHGAMRARLDTPAPATTIDVPEIPDDEITTIERRPPPEVFELGDADLTSEPAAATVRREDPQTARPEQVGRAPSAPAFKLPPVPRPPRK